MKKGVSTIAVVVIGAILLFANANDISLGDLLGSNKTENIETSEADKELIDIQYDKSKYPENYVELNDNKTSLKKEDKAMLNEKGTNGTWQDYDNLDELGRTQTATGLVNNKVVTQRSSKYMKDNGILYDNEKIYERPSFPSYVHVSGEYNDGWFDKSKQRWKGETSNNAQTDLGTYKGWLYNKSHSLGWSLGGDMETHNVTLGTRSQNVGSGQDGGMAYPESEVRNAVMDNKDAEIYYQAEPVYNESELVPRGTHVRAYSVNDDGKTLNLNVWVFNHQDGVDIDYETGEWKEA